MVNENLENNHKSYLYKIQPQKEILFNKTLTLAVKLVSPAKYFDINSIQ